MTHSFNYNNSDRNTRYLMSDAKFFEGYSRWDEDKGRYETWEEAVSRVMNMHRLFYKDKMTNQLSDLIDEAEDLYKQKYFLGAQRALQFGGDQLLKHQMRLYNCFSGDTQFVTRQGVARFDDFADGAKITVKTHTNSWKNAVVKNHGKQQLYKITFRKKSTKQVIRATRDHTWILKDGTRTTSLNVGDKLYNLPDQQFESFDWDAATPDEKLMWCYGLVYGDGTVVQAASGPYSVIRLCGDNVRFKYRFEQLGFETSTNLSLGGDFFAYTGTYAKQLPSVNDSVENLRAFVWGFLDADGEKSSSYWSGSGKSFTNIYQVSPDAQEFIRTVFPVVGAYILSEKDWNGSEVYTNLSGKEYKRTGTTFSLSTTHGTKGSAYWTVESIEKDSVEDVWCVEVEDDRSFVLKSGIVTGNCTSTHADRVEYFGELFYVLLCGAGAGVSIQKHHIDKLPPIQNRTKQAKIHIVSDDIEGWATSADVLMSSYFVGGGKHPEYEGRRVYFDTSPIRDKGAMISGGFKAPGPEPLRRALDKIEHLLQGLVLKGITRLSPIHVYDISMHLADAVLAGGVRRSATIFLFSPDDEEMMKAKTGNWFVDNPQRGRSNNSAVIVRSTADRQQFAKLMQSVREYGEPGFVFVESPEHTYNPCVSGDALVRVKDHDITVDGEVVATGIEYDIRMDSLCTMLRDNYVGGGTSYDVPLALSVNTETGDKEYKHILWGDKTKTAHEVIRITDENTGKYIEVTPDHKIWTVNRGWVEAQNLIETDVLNLVDSEVLHASHN